MQTQTKMLEINWKDINSTHNHNHTNKDVNNAHDNLVYKLILSVQKLNRLERLIVYVGFFILFLLFIFALSKLYKQIKLVKQRYNKYGYLINPKLELAFLNLNRRLKTKKYIVIENIKRRYNCNKSREANRNASYIRIEDLNRDKLFKNLKYDFGHCNEIFEMESILDTEVSNESTINNNNNNNNNDSQTQSINETDFNISTSDNNQNTKHKINNVKNYIDSIRANKFFYKQFKNVECDDATSQEINVNKSNNKIFFNLLDENRKSSLASDFSFDSLTFIKNKIKNYSTMSNKSKKPKSTSMSCKSELSLAVQTTSAAVPLILVTDTSSMHTSIVDLDSFEFESLNLNSTESLLKYYLEEKRPV